MGAAVIVVEDLVKRDRKAAGPAVDGISLDVCNPIAVLITTLLPTRGRVRVVGHDVLS